MLYPGSLLGVPLLLLSFRLFLEDQPNEVHHYLSMMWSEAREHKYLDGLDDLGGSSAFSPVEDACEFYDADETPEAEVVELEIAP